MAERFETQSTKLSSANSVTDVYTLANTDSSDDRSVVLSVMAANTDGTNSVDVSLFVTAAASSSAVVATVEGEKEPASTWRKQLQFQQMLRLNLLRTKLCWIMDKSCVLTLPLQVIAKSLLAPLKSIDALASTVK